MAYTFRRHSLSEVICLSRPNKSASAHSFPSWFYTSTHICPGTLTFQRYLHLCANICKSLVQGLFFFQHGFRRRPFAGRLSGASGGAKKKRMKKVGRAPRGSLSRRSLSRCPPAISHASISVEARHLQDIYRAESILTNCTPARGPSHARTHAALPGPPPLSTIQPQLYPCFFSPFPASPPPPCIPAWIGERRLFHEASAERQSISCIW